ncbi:MAG: PhoPQ-activated protein PqaA family protein [Planctomycetota bacterium]|nr:PhoPQ-activated protein PqaA family protein [Planctomycetota bacterium]
MKVSWLTGICSLLITGLLQGYGFADLDEYVRRPDSSFSWEFVQRKDLGEGTVYVLKLTSQQWMETLWHHELFICESDNLKYTDTAVLLVSSGNNKQSHAKAAIARGLELAQLSGGRCAVLAQVPNQPLLENRFEDDLISETFVHYLKTGNDDWPLLFPMVKSVVRAMDAIQQWSRKGARGEVLKFVVTGASKRGWTTWLTAVVDKRVIAIAPMVIDMLNIPAQIPNQLKQWGQFSIQIVDYTRRGLVQPENQTDRHARLWEMVDPYSYRDRLKIPKLIILGTNDPYWTLNALDLYWHGLTGIKHVLYVPNAGHSLDTPSNYAYSAVAGWFRYTVSGKMIPSIEVKSNLEGGVHHFSIHAVPCPDSAKLWMSHSSNSDFRKSKWSAQTMRREQGVWLSEVPSEGPGQIAVFGDLTYRIGKVPCHFSTRIHGLVSQEPASSP